MSVRAFVLTTLSVAVVASPAPAQNRAGDAIGAAVGLIGSAVANSRLQRDIDAMSAPLVYQSTNPPLDPANPHDPRNFDIAGVRIGMSPEEARKALRVNGYTITYTGEQNSFDTEVRRQANFVSTNVRHILVTGILKATAPDNQEVKVSFQSLPDGTRVDEIHYMMTSEAMSQEAFAGQIQRKYGEPTSDDGAKWLWCIGSEGCDAEWSDRTNMRVSLSDRSIEIYDPDDARVAALQQRIQDEIAKRTPQIKSARF